MFEVLFEFRRSCVLDFRMEDLVSSTCIKENHEAARERGRPDKWNFSFYCDEYQCLKRIVCGPGLHYEAAVPF